MRLQKQSAGVPLKDPDVLTVDCTAAELSDRRFDLAARGYLITAETATEHDWRIEARRCDCDLCSEQRQERARPANSQAARPQNGKAFFEKLREEIRT
jgi:hypothetical protein